MSKLEFAIYPGLGETNRKEYHYSQAVKIGPIIKCAGQGGWDTEGKVKEGDLGNQLEWAYKNVELAIKAAGGSGWDDVAVIRSYHIDLDAQLDAFAEAWKSWMPNHQPLWTCVGVTRLGKPEMLFEIEVEAYVP